MKPIYCLSLKRQAAFSFQHWVHPPEVVYNFPIHTCMFVCPFSYMRKMQSCATQSSFICYLTVPPPISLAA